MSHPRLERSQLPGGDRRCTPGRRNMVPVHSHVRMQLHFILPVPNDTLLDSLVLYMMYFPPHLKYATIPEDAHDSRPSSTRKTNIKSDDWRLSITLSWVVFLHLSVRVLYYVSVRMNPNPCPTERSLHSSPFSSSHLLHLTLRALFALVSYPSGRPSLAYHQQCLLLCNMRRSWCTRTA